MTAVEKSVYFYFKKMKPLPASKTLRQSWAKHATFPSQIVFLFYLFKVTVHVRRIAHAASKAERC